MTVVVDTSIVIKWFVTEADSHLAIDLLRGWGAEGRRPVVPMLDIAELGNVLFKHVLDGVTSTQDALTVLSELPRFVSVMDTGLDHTKRALLLAQQFQRRAVYDMHFLVLAEDLGCEL